MRREEIVVVGGGMAGIAAALAAKKGGSRVTLLDEHPNVGGYLRWSIGVQSGLSRDFDGRLGFEIAQRCWARLYDADVNVQRRSTAWGFFDDMVLGVVNPQSSYRLKADKIILATGSTDIAIPFPGYDLPGVMTSRAALIAMTLHRVLPGRRAGIVGNGSDLEEVVESLTAAGVEIALQVADVHLARAGGDGKVAWLSDGAAQVEVDTVISANGSQPDAALAFQAGVESEYSLAAGTHVPARNENLETSIPGVLVVGGLTAAEAEAEGTLAGRVASNGRDLDEAREHLETLRAASENRPVAPAASDVLVCRCDEITAAAVQQAIAGGATTINDVKRRTRAGMGVCQGIYCTRTIAAMIHETAGVPLDEIVPMTARPPARVISLAELAATPE